MMPHMTVGKEKLRFGKSSSHCIDTFSFESANVVADALSVLVSGFLFVTKHVCFAF